MLVISNLALLPFQFILLILNWSTQLQGTSGNTDRSNITGLKDCTTSQVPSGFEEKC